MVLELPSEVKDRNYVYMPLQEKVVESDEEWSKCGKWILINYIGNVSWLDKTWASLQVLLKNGPLLMIKASTAAMKDYPGTIICYTRPEIAEIKQAADAIRKIVFYECCMYYKINSATENGISVYKGHKRVTNYMHTFRGLLYKLDQTGFWTLEGDLQSKYLRPPLSSKTAKEFLKLDEKSLHSLPSKTRKTFLTAENELVVSDCNFNINTICAMEEEEHGLTEADRVWIIGKKMIENGDFKKMACFKKQHVPSQKMTAEFRFYYTNYYLPDDKHMNPHAYYKPLVELCNSLRRKAHFYRFMYFKTSDNMLYRYSPDGELYDRIVRKFVFLSKTE